ncbi:hypothetical protein [Leucobacter sp. 1207-22]|uniref:hypothetical protein n=1 Tax=Leucobacter sp. 1207-22 TaxID=2604456 RepID=UPI004062E707
MTYPENTSPDLSQLPPPQTTGASSPPTPDLSELPPPTASAVREPTKRPRRRWLIITGAVTAVLIGVIVALSAAGLFTTAPVTAKEPAPEAPVQEHPREPQPVAEEPDKNSSESGLESGLQRDLPGSGAAPIPEQAGKACVFGTTKEVEFYLFQNADNPTGDWIYVGGNSDLGYLELPAVPVTSAGGGVSGHRMTNTDGTTYFLNGHELIVTPATGEGFNQIVRSWEHYGC